MIISIVRFQAPRRAYHDTTKTNSPTVAGNPADLALIRMQSDGLKPLAERANYKGVFDALGRIARHEGVAALWSGAAPTVVRAMALNFGQLAFFSEAKVRLQGVEGLGPRTKTLTGECMR